MGDRLKGEYKGEYNQEPKEPKLAILVDPSNPEGSRKIYSECRRNLDLVNEKCEIWVGCTSSSHRLISYWLKLFRDAGFHKRVCYPGRVEHALSAIYATDLLRPQLLNPYSKKIVKAMTKVGGSLSDVLYKKRGTPKLHNFGYLVLYRDSKVGGKTILRGYPDITDDVAVNATRDYMDKNPYVLGVYPEAGSGAKRSISKRIPLIKSIDKIIKEKTLMAGGGITLDWEVENLLDAGVNKPVIGTHFEHEPEDITVFAKKI